MRHKDKIRMMRLERERLALWQVRNTIADFVMDFPDAEIKNDIAEFNGNTITEAIAQIEEKIEEIEVKCEKYLGELDA